MAGARQGVRKWVPRLNWMDEKVACVPVRSHACGRRRAVSGAPFVTIEQSAGPVRHNADHSMLGCQTQATVL